VLRDEEMRTAILNAPRNLLRSRRATLKVDKPE
jgi:hypothetical protein